MLQPVEMLASERQLEIRNRLERSERVIASDMAQEFGVSEDTIRRDLRELAAAGLCKRVYGGALPLPVRQTSLKDRIETDPARKMRVAKAAVTVIERGTFLFIDAGSTNLAIAKSLPENFELTVATNSPAIAAELFDRNDIELIVIGGRIDRKVGAAIGSKAIRDAEAIMPDLCLLGACGLDEMKGISAFDGDDAEFKHTIAGRSRKVLVAVLNEKFGTAASFAVLPLSGCDYLVVEADFDSTIENSLNNQKTKIVRA